MEFNPVLQELRDIFGEAKKGGYPPGTIRTWKGKGDFKKTKKGDWVPVKGGLKRKAKGGAAAPKAKAKAPEKKLKRKAPAGGAGGPPKKPKAAAEPKGKKKPAGGGGGGGPPKKPTGGPEKTSPGRPAPKEPKAKGPGSAGTRFKPKAAYAKPGAAAPAAEPGDFDEPDFTKQMKNMLKLLPPKEQEKFLKKMSPDEREKMLKPEPEPIKLTKPIGGPDKTAAGRGQKSKPGPPVGSTAVPPPERGGPGKGKTEPMGKAPEPKAAKAPEPKVKPAPNPQGETAASELKKALGHAYKAFKIPFKRMSDHLRKPETREKIKGTFKAVLKSAWNGIKAGARMEVPGIRPLAKLLRPDLFKTASKMARGYKISTEDHEKMKKDLAKVAVELISSVGAYAATGGHPAMFAERAQLKKMTKLAIENKVHELMDYALKKKAGEKKQQSAVEELRYILNAKEDDPDPADLEAIFNELMDLMGSDFDLSDADIGTAFKSSGATPEMAKSWAASESPKEGQNERHANG